MTRILFATDLHGNPTTYDSLLEKAGALSVDAVVLGGDLLPLPPRTPERVSGQSSFAEGWLATRLRLFRRERPSIRVYGLLGNDDWASCMASLEKLQAEGVLGLLHMKTHRLGARHWIAGYSCVPITPYFMCDWDRVDFRGWKADRLPLRFLFSDGDAVREGSLMDLYDRPTIEDDLATLGTLSDPARTVYVIHTPPWNTALDVMQGNVNIGSRSVRTFIEKHQPPLSLHGHIHESPQLSGSIMDRIGKSVCVNPGDSKTSLRAALVDLEDPKGSLQLVT